MVTRDNVITLAVPCGWLQSENKGVSAARNAQQSNGVGGDRYRSRTRSDVRFGTGMMVGATNSASFVVVTCLLLYIFIVW
jgi:hypothetical protein